MTKTLKLHLLTHCFLKLLISKRILLGIFKSDLNKSNLT